MPTFGPNAFTLADWIKRRDPNDQTARIIELLSQRNELLDDIVWIMGNLVTGHRTTIRTGLPTPTWRRYNEGVQPSKSTTAQVDVRVGMLEAYSEIDKDLAELGGDLAGTRLSEAAAHLEGMNQEMARAFIYEDEKTNPERITGLAPHYSTVNPATAASAENVLDAGGVGVDNTSIWLVVWGEDSIIGIFPKGSQAGLIRENLGLQLIADATGIAGAKLQAYVEHFQWKPGLCVKDWRQAVRIANIDVSALETETGAADIVKFLLRAVNTVNALAAGRPAIYVNRKVKKMLDIQVYNKVAGTTLSFETFDGKRVTAFQGIPIRIVDALLNTEARVV